MSGDRWAHIELPKSSNINRVDFDVGQSEVRVEFSSGSTYVYREVPAELIEEWKLAKSSGRFFHAKIRNEFDFEQVPRVVREDGK